MWLNCLGGSDFVSRIFPTWTEYGSCWTLCENVGIPDSVSNRSLWWGTSSEIHTISSQQLFAARSSLQGFGLSWDKLLRTLEVSSSSVDRTMSGGSLDSICFLKQVLSTVTSSAFFGGRRPLFPPRLPLCRISALGLVSFTRNDIGRHGGGNLMTPREWRTFGWSYM